MKLKMIETKRPEAHIILEGILSSFRSRYYSSVSKEVSDKIDELITLVSDRNPELDNYSNIDEIEYIERCMCYKEEK